MLTQEEITELRELMRLHTAFPHQIARIGFYYGKIINPGFPFCPNCPQVVSTCFGRIKDWCGENLNRIELELQKPKDEPKTNTVQPNPGKGKGRNKKSA
jgi:hypothetical protein